MGAALAKNSRAALSRRPSCISSILARALAGVSHGRPARSTKRRILASSSAVNGKSVGWLSQSRPCRCLTRMRFCSALALSWRSSSATRIQARPWAKYGVSWPLKRTWMQVLPSTVCAATCGYTLGSIWAAMAWDRSRRVLSVTSRPTALPLGATPNHNSPAPCLFRMATMDTKPSLSSARLFFSSTVSLSRKLSELIPQPSQLAPNQLVQFRALGHLLTQLFSELLHLGGEVLVVVFRLFRADVAAGGEDVAVLGDFGQLDAAAEAGDVLVGGRRALSQRERE